MANYNFNKVILGGRLTDSPELKTTGTGVTVTSFTIAVNRKYGEQQTDFINCQAWRQTAEFICRYFRKGSSISVVGSIQTRKWQDSNGQNRTATDVVVDEAYFVDGKNDAGQTETAKNDTYIPDAYKTGESKNNGSWEISSDSDFDLPF